MEQMTKGRKLRRVLLVLLALLALLGAVRAYHVEEDPRQAMTGGTLLELSGSWRQETGCRADCPIPSDWGDGLMLSVRAVKADFTLAPAGRRGTGDGILPLPCGHRPG